MLTPPPNPPILATVRPDWVDNNGHMNMGFYLVVFDMACDTLWADLGLGAPFRARGFTTFAAETWVNYVRELHAGQPLTSTSEVLGHDAKRLLCRHYGVTEVSATGAGSATTLRITPLPLPDSAQVRLKRLYPAAGYRATTSTVQVPIPRAGATIGAPRIRDLELVQMVADLLLTLAGRPAGDVDLTTFTPVTQGRG